MGRKERTQTLSLRWIEFAIVVRRWSAHDREIRLWNLEEGRSWNCGRFWSRFGQIKTFIVLNTIGFSSFAGNFSLHAQFSCFVLLWSTVRTNLGLCEEVKLGCN